MSAAILLLLVLIGLLLLGVAAAFAMGLSGVWYFGYTRGFDNLPYEIIAQRIVAGIDSFTLLAVPLFLLVGHLMNESGATTRLFAFANSMVGHVRGGLAHVNVTASMLFAGMSGSGTADAAGLGAIEIRAMREAKYDDRTTLGVTVGSALIGPIIPPSIPAILYAILAEVSAGELLLAGLIPGLLMALALMIMASLFARRRNLPKHEFQGFLRIWQCFCGAFASLLTPVILLGGIFLGIFTATEAAAVAGLWALILACFIYREMGLAKLLGVFRRTTFDSAVILFILACSALFAWVLTRARVPNIIAEWITTLTTSPALILGLIIVFLLIVGCFMAVAVAINILTPILVPVVVMLGFDPIHFGVVMIMTLVIGEATPPFGMVLYVITKVARVSFATVVASIWPWLLAVLAVVLVVAAFPGLALWLPGLMG